LSIDKTIGTENKLVASIVTLNTPLFGLTVSLRSFFNPDLSTVKSKLTFSIRKQAAQS
jgi:hypothetical protein